MLSASPPAQPDQEAKGDLRHAIGRIYVAAIDHATWSVSSMESMKATTGAKLSEAIEGAYRLAYPNPTQENV